ncbi:hypothetical protein EMIT07CA2_60181 [Brevibacillus sp. IT-7CA2]
MMEEVTRIFAINVNKEEAFVQWQIVSRLWYNERSVTKRFRRNLE